MVAVVGRHDCSVVCVCAFCLTQRVLSTRTAAVHATTNCCLEASSAAHGETGECVCGSLQVVGKWRALAEQSKWDDFVASMLQEHYDVVYARAQVKYLTPGNSQQQAYSDSDHAEHSGPEQTVEQHGNSCMQHANSSTGQTESTTGSSDEVDHLQEGNNGVAKAASALSHLFGGPREKLMQQMSTKQAESKLRWHRQPVDDISDEIYSALAVKILTQHDPAAFSQA